MRVASSLLLASFLSGRQAILRSWLPLAALLLVAFASRASALGGLAIRWDRCYGDAGTVNRSFACNTNAGTNTLIASFIIDQDTYSLPRGVQITLGVAAAAEQLPAWWSFQNPGTCRVSSLSANFLVPADAINCADTFSGQGAGGIAAYDVGAWGPSSARIVIAGAAPISPTIGLFAAQEYFLARLRFDNAKTVGAGACAGCAVPLCIVLQSIRLQFNVEPERVLTTPLGGMDSHYVTWQGGGAPTSALGTGCPAATPTRRGTWGSVKALYR